MNPRINQLVKTLLQKNSIEDCSLSELENFAERHPYFGAAQLLLAKKMQTDKPDAYQQQLEKTYAFFHNPLWVQHLLDENKKPVTIIEKIAEPVAVETVEAPASRASGWRESITPVKPQAEPEKELLFEPYHTVDYFASQGIKIKEEEKPKDKFGQQLKSFTEWLKTMKRLTVSEIAAQAEPKIEKKVEEMAATSIQDREVVTEAMAEVWEKQGNRAKAIEIYSKLGLLDPSKSVYFAAKIEELRKTEY